MTTKYRFGSAAYLSETARLEQNSGGNLVTDILLAIRFIMTDTNIHSSLMMKAKEFEAPSTPTTMPFLRIGAVLPVV